MIGLGVITCDRPEFIKTVLSSIPLDKIDVLIIVDDGNTTPVNDGYVKFMRSESNNKGLGCKIHYIQHTPGRLGPAKSKNDALEYLRDEGCDHIFLIEDDIKIIDPNVFEEYIETAKAFNLDHLMFAYHGPANKRGISKGDPAPRLSVCAPNSTKRLELNENCVGAFCYYTRKCLDKVGIIDGRFGQAFDHVEHTYRIIKAGMCTPYWWFPDIGFSTKYLQEIACSEESSTIRKGKDWSDRIQASAKLFYEKHGYQPAWQNCVPDTSEENVIKFLRDKYNEQNK